MQEQFEEQFGDNHKVKLRKKPSKTNGIELGKIASGLWVSSGAIFVGRLVCVEANK